MRHIPSAWLVKIGFVLLLALLCGVIFLLNPEFFTRLGQVLLSGDLQQTTEYIQSFGPWAMVFSFCLTVVVNGIGFPPAIIFSAANALIFGIVPGILIAWLAETVGVTISFLLMRFLLRDAAQGVISRHAALRRFDEMSGRQGFKAMLLARMIPYFPSALLNAVGALSSMSLMSYVLASLLGKLPSTALEAMIGHDAVTVSQHPQRLVLVIVIAAVVIAGFWFYNRRQQHRERMGSNDTAGNKISTAALDEGHEAG